MGHSIEKKAPNDWSVFVHEVYSWVGVWGHIFDNDFMLCGWIFFVRIPNDLYLHWLSADIRYVDLCDTI